MSSGLPAAVLTSVLLHGVGLTLLAMVVGSLWPPSPPSHLITTELVVTPPPPAPAEPITPPALVQVSPPKLGPQAESLPAVPHMAPPPPPVTPPQMEKITPPKLVEKTPIKLAKEPPSRVKTPPPLPKAAETEQPRPGPPIPLPVDNRMAAAGNVLHPPAETPPDTPWQPAEGSEAGAGKLFERGDAGVVPGPGAGGGGGGSGRTGLGTGGAGAGPPVAGLQPGAGGVGSGGGGPLARPLGGYQVKPRYPESARRQGIEGTTLLKIYVSDKGLVEDVLVERSAGHSDLDLAAMEAVKKWRFAPAKRGDQPIAVWVMLPVRFELR